MLDRLSPVAASRSANEVEAYPRCQNTSRAARTTTVSSNCLCRPTLVMLPTMLTY